MYIHKKQRVVTPTNWPVFGTTPTLLVNAHWLHEYTTSVLLQSHGTFMFKGLLFATMDMLFTTDPLDIYHILSKNFSNYPKGDKFRRIFDALGDGILNSDAWRGDGFVGCISKVFFYTLCKLLLDNDPESLSLDFPSIPYSKAFIDGEEAILLRHVTPPFLWKLQHIHRVGNEKKLSDAWKSLDHFIYKFMAQKQKEYDRVSHEAERFIFFTAIMRELKDYSGTSLDLTKFLRDTLVNLAAAGKDSVTSALSWFF
ncbi:putative cytochrome P450 superfamily [Helianthus annuus]|nr:putative cytochrome P450 superfamily [Helianthus annuus]